MKVIFIFSNILVAAALSSCGNFVKFKELATTSSVELSGLNFAIIKVNILDTNCITCHQQYQNYAAVRSDLPQILEAVNTNRMPKSSAPLSANQKSLLAAWASQGAPEFADKPPTPLEPLPPLVPTWSSLHAQVLQPKCVLCHNPNGQAKFLDLSTYEAISANANRDFNGVRFLDFDNPELSYLLQVITDPVEPMPPSSANLPAVTQEEAAMIQEWIRQKIPRE